MADLWLWHREHDSGLLLAFIVKYVVFVVAVAVYFIATRMKKTTIFLSFFYYAFGKTSNNGEEIVWS